METDNFPSFLFVKQDEVQDANTATQETELLMSAQTLGQTSQNAWMRNMCYSKLRK